MLRHINWGISSAVHSFYVWWWAHLSTQLAPVPSTWFPLQQDGLNWRVRALVAPLGTRHAGCITAWAPSYSSDGTKGRYAHPSPLNTSGNWTSTSLALEHVVTSDARLINPSCSQVPRPVMVPRCFLTMKKLRSALRTLHLVNTVHLLQLTNNDRSRLLHVTEKMYLITITDYNPLKVIEKLLECNQLLFMVLHLFIYMFLMVTLRVAETKVVQYLTKFSTTFHYCCSINILVSCSRFCIYSAT